MNTLELKIRELSSEMEWMLSSLDNLSDENFEAKMKEINRKTLRIKDLKQQLKADYDMDALRKFEPGLLKLTKQLSNKFDNIIIKVQTEKDAVALELENIQNKKKLANYNR
ncbi:MAG TPA: hypothetical protein VHO03_21255 [Ignavibacteriales bacterium]|nr:hypothetical protein [Ignavibacteriales bacterium]